MRKAVIDVGSNSVLLLVAEQMAHGWEPVLETSEVTALGEGTKESGLLQPDAIARTLEALEKAARKARDLHAENVLAAGTMALRLARNADDFIEGAAACGIEVEVLSGDEEAELGFQAVATDPVFAQHGRLSIIDVGGHSTELITGTKNAQGWEVDFRRSYSVGALGLRGGSLRNETPPTMAILRAVRDIDDLIALAYLPDQAGHAVALGATPTNLVSIRDKLAQWSPEKVHGAYLDYEDVSKLSGWMMGMTDAERAALVGMERGRERTLHIGALILERFLHALRVLGCSVSVRGWRHALLERP
jgi:exopolyphosphatase / guanosine-5'-triphosphate,3'-diphosphate pyrophosphatase